MNNAPGKGLLKVTGILMIIGGGLAVLLGLLGMAGGAILATQSVALGGVTMLASIVAIVGGAFELIAGIFGVKNCDKPEKAQSCFVFGVILVAFAVLSAIMSLMSGQLSGTSIFSLILGFVLPVLYLMGALKNKEVSGTGVQGGSFIDQAKDAIGDAQADIRTGAMAGEAKEAASDVVEGAKDIAGNVVGAGKEVVDKVTDMVDGNK